MGVTGSSVGVRVSGTRGFPAELQLPAHTAQAHCKNTNTMYSRNIRPLNRLEGLHTALLAFISMFVTDDYYTGQ